MWLDQPGQRILLTGGSGFIGSALCARLAREGHKLTVLTRNRQAARQQIGPAVELIESLDELAPRSSFDVAINLAGEPLASGRWTEKRKRRFYDSRIETTHKLLAFFQQTDTSPGVLINGSAVGYYGPHSDTVMDEEGHGTPSFSHMLCRDWEAAADEFSALGCRVCKVRIGIVLGPDGGALQQMLTPFRLGLGGAMGTGQQWMSWIHREDLLRLFCHCINHQTLQGVVNGTAPNPVRNEEFSKLLAKTLSRPCLLTLPAPMLRLIMGEMADELLLTGQQVIPARALESGFTFTYPELSGAFQQVLGSGKSF